MLPQSLSGASLFTRSLDCMSEWSSGHLVVHVGMVLWGIFHWLCLCMVRVVTLTAGQTVGVSRQVGHCQSLSHYLHCVDGRTVLASGLRLQGLWAKVFLAVGWVLCCWGSTLRQSLLTSGLQVMVLLAAVSGSSLGNVPWNGLVVGWGFLWLVLPFCHF